MPEEERCVKGYIAQSELVSTQLMNIISLFISSRASLIVEGVCLSVDLMMRIVAQFPNVIPFLIYIKKEGFYAQRFAVRAKYMTTDPSVNRCIRHFTAIRTIQSSLSKDASSSLIPKIDNRNIDRSMETMHQTLFSYLKKLEGRPTMLGTFSQRLTFLDSVWKRRKQKLTSKSKTIKAIRALKKGTSPEPVPVQPEISFDEVIKSLPHDGKRVASEDMVGDGIAYQQGTMTLLHEERKSVSDESELEPVPQSTAPPETPDDGDAETEPYPVEITLTDFLETGDSQISHPLYRNDRF
jgi:hypothetical protein